MAREGIRGGKSAACNSNNHRRRTDNTRGEMVESLGTTIPRGDGGWFSYSRCRAPIESDGCVRRNALLLLLPPPSLFYYRHSAATLARSTVIVHVDAESHHRELDIDSNDITTTSIAYHGADISLFSKFSYSYSYS